MGPDLENVLWRPSRTPEEVLMEREEAQQTLTTDRALKRRVEWAAKQYARTQAAMAGGGIGGCLGTSHLGLVGEKYASAPVAIHIAV